MKLTVCLSASWLALLACPGGARAASPDDQPANPYAQLDADGVPLVVTQGAKDEPTQADRAAVQQAIADAERARNWLLLDYQEEAQREKAQAAGKPGASNAGLKLSLDGDLAGLNADDTSSSPPPQPRLHSSPDSSSREGLTLRPDSSTSVKKNEFAPLINISNSAAVTSAIQPFYTSPYASPLPDSLAPGTFLPDSQPTPTPAHAPTPSAEPRALPTLPTDTVDLETPGMIADKTTPLPGTPDLSLDSVPDPNADSSTPAQDPNQPPQLPQLPQPMDADELHLEQEKKLEAADPIAARAAAKAKAEKQQQMTQAQPPTPPMPETPMPIMQQPVLSPVHPPIPNPYDILNR